MKSVESAVTAYLQAAASVPAVAERSRAAGVYPLLAVSVREGGTVLVDGGRQAEHTYHATVTAASDRHREGAGALLSVTPSALAICATVCSTIFRAVCSVSERCSVSLPLVFRLV